MLACGGFTGCQKNIQHICVALSFCGTDTDRGSRWLIALDLVFLYTTDGEGSYRVFNVRADFQGHQTEVSAVTHTMN